MEDVIGINDYPQPSQNGHNHANSSQLQPCHEERGQLRKNGTRSTMGWNGAGAAGDERRGGKEWRELGRRERTASFGGDENDSDEDDVKKLKKRTRTTRCGILRQRSTRCLQTCDTAARQITAWKAKRKRVKTC